MNRFIRKVLLFTVVTAVTFLLIIVVDAIIYSSEYDNIFNMKQKEVLLLGDSNMECALNDSIFDESLNRAADADSYFYSYLKLREFIELNGKIGAVFLSFAPHDIYDNGWLLDDRHINSHLKKYFFMMDFKDFTFIFTKNPKGVVASVLSIVEETFRNIVKKATGKNIVKTYGSFFSLERNSLQELKLKLKNGEKLPFFSLPENQDVYMNEIFYLDKIVELCKSHNIKLYFVNLPKREELIAYPKYGATTFYKLYDTRYSEIPFLDFSRLKMDEDYYGDFIHLNRKGATYFSNFIKSHSINELEISYSRNKSR